MITKEKLLEHYTPEEVNEFLATIWDEGCFSTDEVYPPFGHYVECAGWSDCYCGIPKNPYKGPVKFARCLLCDNYADQMYSPFCYACDSIDFAIINSHIVSDTDNRLYCTGEYNKGRVDIHLCLSEIMNMRDELCPTCVKAVLP